VFHGRSDVVTSELVAIGLHIRNTSDFQIRFRLRELEGEYFIIASAVDQFEVSFYSVEVACVWDTIHADRNPSWTGVDELSSCC